MRPLSVRQKRLLAVIVVAFAGCADGQHGIRVTPESATMSLPQASLLETVIHRFGRRGDGAAPVANLLNVQGTLYGTTISGGEARCYIGCGTVFRITTDGTESVIHRFTGADGESPAASLIDVTERSTARRSKAGTDARTVPSAVAERSSALRPQESSRCFTGSWIRRTATFRKRASST